MMQEDNCLDILPSSSVFVQDSFQTHLHSIDNVEDNNSNEFEHSPDTILEDSFAPILDNAVHTYSNNNKLNQLEDSFALSESKQKPIFSKHTNVVGTAIAVDNSVDTDEFRELEAALEGHEDDFQSVSYDLTTNSHNLQYESTATGTGQDTSFTQPNSPAQSYNFKQSYRFRQSNNSPTQANNSFRQSNNSSIHFNTRPTQSTSSTQYVSNATSTTNWREVHTQMSDASSDTSKKHDTVNYNVKDNLLDSNAPVSSLVAQYFHHPSKVKNNFEAVHSSNLSDSKTLMAHETYLDQEEDGASCDYETSSSILQEHSKKNVDSSSKKHSTQAKKIHQSNKTSAMSQADSNNTATAEKKKQGARQTSALPISRDRTKKKFDKAQTMYDTNTDNTEQLLAKQTNGTTSSRNTSQVGSFKHRSRANTRTMLSISSEKPCCNASIELQTLQKNMKDAQAALEKERQEFEAWRTNTKKSTEKWCQQQKEKAKQQVRVANRQAKTELAAAITERAKRNDSELQAVQATLAKVRLDSQHEKTKLQAQVHQYKRMNDKLKTEVASLQEQVRQYEELRLNAWDADAERMKEAESMETSLIDTSSVRSHTYIEKQPKPHLKDQKNTKQHPNSKRNQDTLAGHSYTQTHTNDTFKYDSYTHMDHYLSAEELNDSNQTNISSATPQNHVSLAAQHNNPTLAAQHNYPTLATQQNMANQHNNLSSSIQLMKTETSQNTDMSYQNNLTVSNRSIPESTSIDKSSISNKDLTLSSDILNGANKHHSSTVQVHSSTIQSSSRPDWTFNQDPEPGITTFLPHDTNPVHMNEIGDGKKEYLYPNGFRVLIFRNGTIKEHAPDGKTLVRFHNGDIKRTYPLEKLTVYYYASVDTTHVTHETGEQYLYFSSGQVERHFMDGAKSIWFTDGTLKEISPDGITTSYFTDGTILHEYVDGTREMIQTQSSYNT